MSGFILIFFDDFQPSPSSQLVADGQPEPSSNAGSAKSGRSNPAVGKGRASDTNHSASKFEQAVTHSPKPPLKTADDYRPHCQHKDTCAASGLQHCYACQKLMAAEVSA